MKTVNIQKKTKSHNLSLLTLALLSLLALVPPATAQVSFVEQAKLAAADSAVQDAHGFAVAVSGDTAVVGAPRNGGTGPANSLRGAAYVYVRSGAAWTLQQKLTASDSALNDQFGYAVAINGDTIAIGRQNTVTGQNRSDGKVYIFTRGSGGVWSETQTLTASDIAQGDVFGSRLAFDGDTLAVSSYLKNNGATFFQGAVYVFTRTGANFTQQAKLLAADGAQFDYFGFQIALSGDTLAVSAVGQAGFPNSRGKGYIFVRSGASWSQQQILQASDGVTGDAFGQSVALDGETVVFGAPFDGTNSTSAHGAAYVFTRSGAAWSEQQKIIHADPAINDGFGTSVAVKGNTIAVGATGYESVPGIANHGAVFIFTRGGAAWSQTQKLIHGDTGPNNLGGSLAFGGTTIVTGAFANSNDKGAAYVFAPDIYARQRLTAAGSGSFGHSTAISGDTLVVGASDEQREDPNTGFWNDGAVYIYRRSGTNWEFEQRLVAPDEANGRQFGESVAISGDTLVVGAFTDRIGSNGAQGSAYVFTRANATWSFQQKLTASDGAPADNFGSQVRISGDVVAVSAARDDVGANVDQGSVYIFTRAGGAVWSQALKITAADGAAGDAFGGGAALSGTTLLVGVAGDDGARGSVYVYTGGGAAWTFQQKLTAADGAAGDEFGKSVSLSGDSALVGSFADNVNGNSQQGSAYVFTRAGAAWTEQQKLTATDGAATDWFGFSVAISGDTALVGANFEDTAPLINNGAAYLFTRAGGVWTPARKLFADDAATSDEFGYSVALDGGRLAVGADEKMIETPASEGAVYVFTDTTANFSSSRPAFDYDGDGRADLSVFRPSTDTWYINPSTNVNALSAVQFGLSTDRFAPADYDGDGRADIAVWREGARSRFYILESSGGTVREEDFGTAGDNPAFVGDWDGDGKADPAVYRPSTNTFYYRGSANNPAGNITYLAWGASGDRPMRGDFDGDGRMDAAVFRPSNGIWYILQSSNGQVRYDNWGLENDKFVPADYDGDGKTDLAVFRGGTWYVKQSSNDQPRYENFGLGTDALAPADYDGDGRADVAVYRGGVWYIRQSSNGQIVYRNFGSPGDAAIANAFVQ